MTEPHLLTELVGHVYVVTMNRPEARNAITAEMRALLTEAWDEVDANPEIRVAVLTGAGGAFCAGADLKDMNQKQENGSSGGLTDEVAASMLKGRHLTKPLIAAVEGAAVAGGSELLLATDIRVAGESARFGISEVRWSLFPVAGSTVRLRRQIPYTLAAELLLTGRHLRAPEAKEIGLVGRVVPDGQALQVAMELAEQVAANGPVAVQAVLRSLRETEAVAEDDAMRIESQIGMAVFTSEDAKEGPRAFMEKRTPAYQGR